jgi:hypothetical protein
MARDRDEGGKFTEEVSLERVAKVLEDDEPVKTAKEVGQEIGCSSETARQKLLELRDRGVVERKKVGAGAVVWWLVDESVSLEEPQEIDPEDPLFTGGALFSSEEAIDEEDIDETLYGEVE